MKLTRLGLGCVVMAALTLLTAASTGNNLLYLVYGSLSAALLTAAVLGWLNLRGVEVAAQAPPQVFKDQPFSLPLRVSVKGWWPSYGLELRWQGSEARAERVAPGEPAVAAVRGALPHRGYNDLDDLIVESAFPFGLFSFRRGVAAARLLALPRPQPVREAREVAAAAQATGRPTVRKGSGDELYGIREFAPGDDARILNWKLSARLGRPLVNEYCAAQDDKITVTVAAGRGDSLEKAVERAASACKFYIDAGAEVRLASGEEPVDYGRGLAHLDRLLAALARLGEGRRPRAAGKAPAAPWRGAADSTALRRLTLGLMFLVFGGMFLVDEISPQLLLLALPLLLAGVWVQEKRVEVLPRWSWNAISLLVLGYTLLVDWRLQGVTVSNTHLLLYLLVNRALTPFSREELGQVFLILFLAFFLVSGLTISLWYFALFCAYAWGASLWLALASGAPFAARASWKRGFAGGLAAAALAGVLLFAATPRVEGLRRINPFLAAGIDKLSVQPGGVTAFTEDLTLGFFGRLKKSSARFMRVKPVPTPGEDVRPPFLYLRGSAYDAFDGRHWTRTSLRVLWARRHGDDLIFPARPPVKDAPAFAIQIYPMNLSVAFTVGTPARMSDADVVAGYDLTDSVRFAAPYQGGAHYTVQPSPDAGFGATRPGYETAVLPRYLQVPYDKTGRVAELARQIAGGAPDAASKVSAVAQFLRKRYDYSMYSTGGQGTLQEFLFKTREGNCEYFASAAAILLRHQGVPTRLVTGFLAGDWNEYGKFYDVRQAEAHAWVEAYIPGRGWVPFDPTPSQSAISAGVEELGKKIEHWAAALEAQWYRHVIGYDQFVQKDTFKRLGDALSAKTLEGFARGVGLALLLGAFLAAAGEGLKRLRRPRAAPPTLLQLAEEALRRRGLARAPHQTAREFALAAAGERPELAALPELAELHYLDRYAPGGLSPDQRQRALALLAALRSARAS
jgi:transglutaminase-like putative cysteine protease/uncharacterized protein (DUF58 family)